MQEFVDSPAVTEMPRYKCHKEVWALKIRNIQPGLQGGGILEFEDRRYGPRHVNAAYMERHQPKVGGYFVVYRDGYESWSPAEAFESGYTLME